jgi:hypothetical protein
VDPLNLSNVTNDTLAHLNETLGNATGISPHTSNVLVDLFTVAIPAIAVRFWYLVSAPFRFSEMQWILIPLMLTFVLTEFYFFRHTDEELGWNAAMLNSMVLVFVAIDLVKTVFAGDTPWQVIKLFWQALLTGEHLSMLLTIIFIGGLGLALIAINYLHLLPRRVAYVISSHPPINFVAYFAIVVVYSDHAGTPLPLDGYTVAAATILFIVIVALIFTLQQMFGTKSTAYYTRES